MILVFSHKNKNAIKQILTICCLYINLKIECEIIAIYICIFKNFNVRWDSSRLISENVRLIFDRLTALLKYIFLICGKKEVRFALQRISNCTQTTIWKICICFVFSKDAWNWSKATVKTFTLLHKISVSNKCCSFKCYICQKSKKWLWFSQKKLSITTVHNFNKNKCFLSTKSTYQKDHVTLKTRVTTAGNSALPSQK